MSELWRVLGIIAIPAVGALLGGLLAEGVKLSSRKVSLAIHWAAGTLLAVIGIQLMPRALEAQPAWPQVLVFVAGGLFLVGLNWATSIVQTIRQTDGGGRRQSSSKPRKGADPGGSEKGSSRSQKDGGSRSKGGGSSGGKAAWVIFLGVAVDLFTDGLIIGTGTTLSQGLGLLLGLALFAADTPEAFSTIATLKQQRSGRRTRLLIAASYPIVLIGGGLIGYLVFGNASEPVKLGVMSFTAGEVLALVISEMVREAHREWQGRWAVLLVIGGFALFALLTTFIE